MLGAVVGPGEFSTPLNMGSDINEATALGTCFGRQSGRESQLRFDEAARK
jgi:hypothetical protein